MTASRICWRRRPAAASRKSGRPTRNSCGPALGELRMTAFFKGFLAVLGLLVIVAPASAQVPAAQYREFLSGNPGAKVTVIEYASLTCPACAMFHNLTFPLLKKNYIDTGKIKFIYRDFPLDGLAMAAALMVRC